MEKFSAFKAYDIRGIYLDDLDEELAFHVGKALATYLNAEFLVVGRDIRESSESLFEALVNGITQTGCNVIDIGLCSTPEFYFAIYYTDQEGGVMITASHNPKEYNGLKICGERAQPIYKDKGFPQIKDIMTTEEYKSSSQRGYVKEIDIKPDYAEFFSTFVKKSDRKLKALIDTGNGMGVFEVQTLKKIFGQCLETTTLFEELNGNFPNHECNPIKEEQMQTLMQTLKQGEYDLGIGFDGDGDRVAFFTSDGQLIQADYMIPLIASQVAKAGDTIGMDATCSRAVEETLQEKGFKPVRFRVGRSYIGEGMKDTKAVFAGEKSGHSFFQKLQYTDSSLLACIEVVNLLLSQEKNLKEIIAPITSKYINTGNINITIQEKDKAIAAVKEVFAAKGANISELDGVSVTTDDYFFNVRKSNTEPIIRFTLEAKTQSIVDAIKKEVEDIVNTIK